MALETYTGYIPALVDTNPPATDPAAQGAAHLRGIKLTLSQTFIGFTEPDVGVTKKASEINDLFSATDAALKADIDSPALTGIPTAPTADPGDNSTQIATTAYADSAAIGVGQTWQNFTGSRALSAVYTNSSGKPIQLSVQMGLSVNGTAAFYMNGVQMAEMASVQANNSVMSFYQIVPNGSTYEIRQVGAIAVSVQRWWELRA